MLFTKLYKKLKVCSIIETLITKIVLLMYLWHDYRKSRSSHQRCSMKKGVLRNFTKFTGKQLQANVIKKETLGHVFSCKFCEISKNTFSYRTLTVATSEDQINLVTILKFTSLNLHFENFTKNKRRVVKYSTSFSVYSCLWKSCYTEFRYI